MIHVPGVLDDDYAGNHQFARPTRLGGAEIRELNPGDYVYREGDLRTHIYRVERGAIAVFEARIRSVTNTGMIVQGKGGYVGLGFLERHIGNALAIVNSTLVFVSRAEVAVLRKHDPKLQLDHADAIDKDFEYRKSQVIYKGPLTPVRRLAAFLAAEAHLSEYEGCSPSSVADCLKPEIAGSLLGLDPDTFAMAVRELEGLGFVERNHAGGIRLKNIEGLVRL